MKVNRILKRNLGSHRRCRTSVDGKLTKKFLKRIPSEKEYMADIEQLQKALLEIETKYYATNKKIEQIEKMRRSQIILYKLNKMFSSDLKKIENTDNVGNAEDN